MKHLGFSADIDIHFAVRRLEIAFVVVFGPAFVWFSCMDRNWRGLSAGIAIDLFFLCVPKMTCF